MVYLWVLFFVAHGKGSAKFCCGQMPSDDIFAVGNALDGLSNKSALEMDREWWGLGD